jgi:hypothetical protein
MDLFYVGTTNNVVHLYNRGGGVWNIHDMGAPAGYNVFGQIGAASWANTRVDVFVLAKQKPLTDTSNDPSKSLFHQFWDANRGGWSGWQYVGPATPYQNFLEKGVSATSWAIGRIDVVGPPSTSFDNHIAHWCCLTADACSAPMWSSDSWTTADAVGVVPDITAIAGSGPLHVFYESYTTGDVKHGFWTSGFNEEDWGQPCIGSLMTPLLGAAVTGTAGGPRVAAGCFNSGANEYDYYNSYGANAWTYLGTDPPSYPDEGVGGGAQL